MTSATIDTITDLLAVVEGLPEPRRSDARTRIAAALAGPAPAARLALGALALDLAAHGDTDLLVDPHAARTTA